MSGEALETTPLLSDPANDNGREPPQGVAASITVDEHYARFGNILRILTALSVFLALTTLISGFVGLVIHDQTDSPRRYIPYSTRGVMDITLLVTLIAAFFGFFNLVRLHYSNRLVWLWLNLICDIIFIFFAFDYAWVVLAYIVSPGFSCNVDSDSCRRFAKIIAVLFGVSVGSALLLGFVFLTLFLIHCILAHNIWTWGWLRWENGRWSVPTGVFAIEVSIKFLRPEERVAERDQNSS